MIILVVRYLKKFVHPSLCCLWLLLLLLLSVSNDRMILVLIIRNTFLYVCHIFFLIAIITVIIHLVQSCNVLLTYSVGITKEVY